MDIGPETVQHLQPGHPPGCNQDPDDILNSAKIEGIEPCYLDWLGDSSPESTMGLKMLLSYYQ